jgi:hypothetical protein
MNSQAWVNSLIAAGAILYFGLAIIRPDLMTKFLDRGTGRLSGHSDRQVRISALLFLVSVALLMWLTSSK